MRRFLRILNIIWWGLTVLMLISTALSGGKNWITRYDPTSDSRLPREYIVLPEGTQLAREPFGVPVYIIQGKFSLWEILDRDYDNQPNVDRATGGGMALSFKVCSVFQTNALDIAFVETERINFPHPVHSDMAACLWTAHTNSPIFVKAAAKAILEAVGILKLLQVGVTWLLGRNKNKSSKSSGNLNPGYS